MILWYLEVWSACTVQYFQKLTSQKTKKLFSYGILEATDEKSRIRIMSRSRIGMSVVRIRIRTKISRTHNTGNTDSEVLEQHGTVPGEITSSALASQRWIVRDCDASRGLQTNIS